MTVTYGNNVQNSRWYGFGKVLLRWRGSFYKLMYREFIIYFIVYALIHIIYDYILDESAQASAQIFYGYFDTVPGYIPLSFILGFYVSLVISRWWDSYMCIPWPDRVASCVTTFIHGDDDETRMLRRTIIRYTSLTSIISIRDMCEAVKRRFPEKEHLIKAGIMTEEEGHLLFEQMPKRHGIYWVPIQWACTLAERAAEQKKIRNSDALKMLFEELHSFRGSCGMLLSYDWITVPLEYTQVVALAVYLYFLAMLFVAQTSDVIVPVSLVIEFMFYFGWLKVAEAHLNPFGDDDNDFEMNWILERNLQIGLLWTDLHDKCPPLMRDKYWNKPDFTLPHTQASQKWFSNIPLVGTTYFTKLNAKDKRIIENAEDETLELNPRF